MYSQSFINPHFSGLLRTNMMSAPSWLVSSVGRALHRYRKGQGMQIPYRPEFFPGFIFTTAQLVFITAKVAFIYISKENCLDLIIHYT